MCLRVKPLRECTTDQSQKEPHEATFYIKVATKPVSSSLGHSHSALRHFTFFVETSKNTHPWDIAGIKLAERYW